MRKLFIRLLPSILLTIVLCACTPGIVSNTHKAIATPNSPDGIPIPVYGGFGPFLHAFLTDLQLKDYHDIDGTVADQGLVLYCDGIVWHSKCQYTWKETKAMLSSGRLKFTILQPTKIYPGGTEGNHPCFIGGSGAADDVINIEYSESGIPGYTPTQGYAQMPFIDMSTDPNGPFKWYLMAIVLNARCVDY